jgi:hypothetical protein
MQHGHSQSFAEQAAESVAQLAAHKMPSYPGTFNVALGSAGYCISADLADGKLVLLGLKRLV